MTAHPLTEVFPYYPEHDGQFEEFAEAVLNEKIPRDVFLYEGMILSGRRMVRAAEKYTKTIRYIHLSFPSHEGALKWLIEKQKEQRKLGKPDLARAACILAPNYLHNTSIRRRPMILGGKIRCMTSDEAARFVGGIESKSAVSAYRKAFGDERLKRAIILKRISLATATDISAMPEPDRTRAYEGAMLSKKMVRTKRKPEEPAVEKPVDLHAEPDELAIQILSRMTECKASKLAAALNDLISRRESARARGLRYGN